MPAFARDGYIFNFVDNKPNEWPALVCSQANLLALNNSDLQLDAARSVRLQDGGQLSFQRDGQISAQGTFSLRVGGSPTEQVRVLADGKVGIGTATPSQMLEVNGAVKATHFIKGADALVSSQWSSVAGGITYTGGRVGIGVLTVNGAAELKNTLAVAGNGTFEKNLTVKGKTILEQEKWQDAPPMQNNWQPYNRGYNPPQYFKDSQGIVHLRGLIQGGTKFGHDIGLIFTLPQGYRPPNRQLHVVSTHSDSTPPVFCGRVDVLADGSLVCVVGNAAWLCLDSISFRSS